MKSIQQSLRHPDALVPNLLVLAYILLGYPGGWLLMAQPGWLLPALGVLACGHAMVIAAYPVSYTHLTLPTICSV